MLLFVVVRAMLVVSRRVPCAVYDRAADEATGGLAYDKGTLNRLTAMFDLQRGLDTVDATLCQFLREVLM